MLYINIPKYNFWNVKRIRHERIIKKLGIKIRQLRVEKELSQLDLSAKSDITLNQIGRIERGEINPTISTLHSLALAFGISVSELLLDVEQE